MGVIDSGNITLAMNGQTLDSNISALNVNGGTLTITGGGWLDNVSSGTVSGGGTVIFESGTIQNIAPQFKGKIIVKGGTIDDIMSQNAAIEFEPGNLVLNKEELTLDVGKSEQLSASVTPTISVPGFGYSWESSDTAVATVAADGIVTAVAPGEATITVKAGDKIATCSVTVTEDYVATVTIDGVETGYPTLAAAIKAADGKTATITVLQSTTEAADIYGGNITLDLKKGCFVNHWIVIYGGVIKVIGEGELLQLNNGGSNKESFGEIIIEGGEITTLRNEGGKTTVSEGNIASLSDWGGTTTITGGYISSLKGSGDIIVKGGTIRVIFKGTNLSYEPDSVTLDQSELSLQVNEQKTLSATVTPNISAPGFPVWESSDEAVATVSNGTVTAVGAGTADITVTAGNKSQTCKVTVGAVASVTIDGQTQDYTNLDDAAAAVSGTGGTLTLLKDVSGRTQPLELSGPMTFDLGGHTLSGAWEDDPYGGLLEITSGVVEVKNGNVSVPGDTGVLCCAIAVREGATLSGNATYSANSWGNVVYNKGTIQEGNFYGECTLYGTVQGGNFYITSLNVVGRIEGGIFNNTRPGALGVTFGIGGVILGGTFNNTNIICTSNSLFQGGTFNNCGFYVISDYFVSGEMILASGYVAYDTSGKIVIDRQPQIGLTTMNFTGTIEPHKSHTYDFTNSEDGNGNYTCSETTCPICGITAPEGAAYTVTIPKTAQLGSDTEVSVNNSLSQEKTVTVSMNETQVTLTRENDPEQTQIVSDVTFNGISITKGQKDTEKVTFAPPVYNDDPNAVIPAGTYKGTLTFTIGMQ